MSAWEVFVQLVAKLLLIVPLHNLVLETSVPILVDKLHVDPMPNVRLLTKRLNALAWLDSCPILLQSSVVLANPQLVSPTTNVLLASNVMPSFVDLSVTLMEPVCPTSSVLTTFAKKSANQTVNVEPMRSVKVSNASQDAGPILTAQSPSLVKTTSVLILAPLPNVVSMPFVSLKITSHSAVAHRE